MKNYLSFKLNGGTIFPYFILIWIAASIGVILNMTIFKTPTLLNGQLSDFLFPCLGSVTTVIFAILIELLCMFYIVARAINAISYNDIFLKFNQNFNTFLVVVFKGMLLSIITLGIYYPWFIKKYIDYYADNTSYDNKKIKFESTGINLFAIYLCWLIAYIFLVALGTFLSILLAPVLGLIVLVFAVLSVGVMFYLVCKWYINFRIDDRYSVALNSVSNVSGSLFIIGQFVLIIITLGIYIPAADIRIFRYFARRVEVKDESGVIVKRVGCDLSMQDDFMYVFGQYILIIITLGVYVPWAYCFIYQRYLSKTYTEEV